jgi:hypothetical protein
MDRSNPAQAIPVPLTYIPELAEANYEFFEIDANLLP